MEDLVFTHAWVFPDLRRSELGDLLLAVARTDGVRGASGVMLRSNVGTEAECKQISWANSARLLALTPEHGEFTVPARRHQDESIDDVDRGFIATLKCDVPGLLKLLSSMPEKLLGCAGWLDMPSRVDPYWS